jgi:hypothetical protein
MAKDHLHLEFAPGWLLEDANSLSCGACPQHRLVQVNMGPASLRFTFESFQAFTSLMQRMSDQIASTETLSDPMAGLPHAESGGKVISAVFPQREH